MKPILSPSCPTDLTASSTVPDKHTQSDGERRDNNCQPQVLDPTRATCQTLSQQDQPADDKPDHYVMSSHLPPPHKTPPTQPATPPPTRAPGGPPTSVPAPLPTRAPPEPATHSRVCNPTDR